MAADAVVHNGDRRPEEALQEPSVGREGPPLRTEREQHGAPVLLALDGGDRGHRCDGLIAGSRRRVEYRFTVGMTGRKEDGWDLRDPSDRRHADGERVT